MGGAYAREPTVPHAIRKRWERYGAPEWAYLAFVKAYNEYIRLSNPIV